MKAFKLDDFYSLKALLFILILVFLIVPSISFLLLKLKDCLVSIREQMIEMKSEDKKNTTIK